MNIVTNKVADLSITRSKTKKSHNVRPFLFHSKHELEVYRNTPKIYGEMKYARVFRRQTMSFLDLPAELRVKIYRNAFLFEEPIEFYARTDSVNHDYWVRKDTHTFLMNLIKRRLLNLGFLRTCRTVQSEGSEVFYGENEFRFSGLNGHMVANLFIRKISDGTDSVQGVQPLPSASWVDQKRFEFDTAFEHLVWNLNRIEKSKKLVLILHWDSEFKSLFRHEESLENEPILTTFHTLFKEKPNLQLDIVRMNPKPRVSDGVFATDADFWKSLHQSSDHVRMIQKFKSLVKNCTVKAAYEHRRGLWEVIDDIPEDVLLE
ncbi:Nn.00g011500.m01.CDS01 [Neocucurbitaria sp. VM-36]